MTTTFSSSTSSTNVDGVNNDDDDDEGKDELEGTSTTMFNKYLNDFHEHFWYIVVIVCLSAILLFRCFCSSSKNESSSRTYLQRRDFSHTPQSIEKRPLLKREKKNVPVVVDGFLMRKDCIRNDDDIEMTAAAAVVIPEGHVIGDLVVSTTTETAPSSKMRRGSVVLKEFFIDYL